MEIYKEIHGISISNLGNVKPRNKMLTKRKRRIRTHGYEEIQSQVNKVRKSYLVHRLVALAFIPNPENKLEVNHIDGDKLNNNVDNLEWCTSSENTRHAFRIGLMKGVKNIRSAKITREDADIIRLSNKTNVLLAKLYNISTTSIHNIKKGKTWI